MRRGEGKRRGGEKRDREGRKGKEDFIVALCTLIDFLYDVHVECEAVSRVPPTLTENVGLVCFLCRLGEMRVNMILAVWTFENPNPLTVKGIPPLQSGVAHHVSSTGHMIVM